MKPRTLTALLLATLLAAPLASALILRVSNDTPPVIACNFQHVAAGDYYVSVDGPTSVWIYEESNGIGGLQRADEVCDDTAGGTIKADTVHV